MWQITKFTDIDILLLLRFTHHCLHWRHWPQKAKPSSHDGLDRTSSFLYRISTEQRLVVWRCEPLWNTDSTRSCVCTVEEWNMCLTCIGGKWKRTCCCFSGDHLNGNAASREGRSVQSGDESLSLRKRSAFGDAVPLRCVSQDEMKRSSWQPYTCTICGFSCPHGLDF